MKYYNRPQIGSANVFLIDEQKQETTYTEFYEFSAILSSKISARAVVLVLCESSTESVLGIFSLLINGQVPILIDPGLDKSLLGKLINTYRPEYIYLPQSKMNVIEDVNIIHYGKSYVLIKTPYESNIHCHDDLALLLTTSGSTGSPKLVRLSYKNIESNGSSIVNYLGIDSSDRAITTLPSNYSYGFSILNSHYLAGASVILTKSSLVERSFWEMFAEFKPTSLSGVPFTFEMLKKMRFLKSEPEHLKVITQAGGRMDLGLIQEFSEFSSRKHIKFFVMYGQTEATARISYLSHEDTLRKLGSIGKAIPGGEIILMPESSSPMNQDHKVGELIYRGSNVMMGYAESRHDLMKGDLMKGELRTGDIARVDDEGFLYIVGRIRRFLKVQGKRVNLDEIEILLKDVVASSACSGVDDKIVIFLEEEGSMEMVREFLANKIAINRLSIHLVHVSKIPHLQNGKVDYSELDKRIGD